jgi:hypothetical protein
MNTRSIIGKVREIALEQSFQHVTICNMAASWLSGNGSILTRTLSLRKHGWMAEG